MSSFESLSLIPETSTLDISKAKSLLLSDIWKVVNKNSFERNYKGEIVLDGNGQKVFESADINIKNLYDGMPIEYELNVKIALLNNVHTHNGIIYAKLSTFRSEILIYALIKKTMDDLGIRFLNEINQNNLKDFCINFIESGSEYGLYGGLRSYAVFKKVFSRLGNLTYNSDSLGLLDYPSFSFILEDCIQHVQETVAKRMPYKEWLKGGTWGNTPIEIAIVILSEALEYFESDDIRRLIALIKSVSLTSIKNKISNPANLIQAINYFLKADFGRDDNGVFQNIKKKKKFKLYKNSFKRDKKQSVYTFDIAESYFDLCDEYQVGYKFDMDVNTCRGLAAAVREAFFRVSATLSILTACRHSELASLKKDAFEVVNDRCVFTSKIKKTNNDSETIRPTTIHAAPIAWVAKELSQIGYQHLGSSDPNPFLLKSHLPWSNAKSSVMAIDALSWKSSSSLSTFYKELLGGLISDFDINETPLSSHRLRHTWPELAIRRFDGNVPEAIRNYFRHWHGSYMTMEYIRGKLKADLPEICRSYLRELIHRAVYDDEKFYGPAGRYLLTRLKEIDLVDPENVDSLLDEFDVIEVHEYSYCAIPKKFKTQAKCWDKETQTPNYDDARWSNCGGCSGRLTLSNGPHRDEIMRIGMAAQEMMNTNNSRGVGSLNTFWKKQLKQAEFALNELDNRIPIVQVETEENL